MPKNKDIIAIYSRKSRFTGKGESIGNQIDLCRTYIAENFGASYAENAIIFEDEGFSGGNTNRPDFKKMIQAAHEQQFKAVVVYRLDRISRNISDFSHLIEELGHLDIDFISIRERFDTSSPMGRAMMYIASVFSQLERETIAERIRDNMHELAKTGRWLGGVTPTGYASEHTQSITVDGKRKKSCNLSLIPEEAEMIRKIYALYLQTDSLTGTESELIRLHIKTKTGCDFTRFSIKSILQNPVYLIADQAAHQYFTDNHADLFSPLTAFDGTHGILAYNRTHQEKGHATVYLPISEWIISVGQHPGLIPSGQWIRVQSSLERNQSKSYRKPRSNTALLTGLLWCSCGSRMYPKLSGRRTANDEPQYTYVCKQKTHSKRSLCRQRNLNGNFIDAAILSQIADVPVDIYHVIQQLEQNKRLYLKKQPEQKHARLYQEQREIEHKINILVDSLADFDGSTAALHIKKRIEALHAQSIALQSQITELQAAPALSPLSNSAQKEICHHLCFPKDSISHMSVAHKRALVHAAIHKVVWNGESVHIMLSGAPDLPPTENNTQLCEDCK